MVRATAVRGNSGTAMCPGLVSYLEFNVMGGLSLLLVLFLPPRGGGGISMSVPVFPWDFLKSQPFQVSIRSKTHHLLNKFLRAPTSQLLK